MNQFFRFVALIFLFVTSYLFYFWNSESEVSYYDFSKNFGLASFKSETQKIDIGTNSAHQHQVRGWSKDQILPHNKVTYAWGVGDYSEIQFEVVTPRDLKLQFRAHPFSHKGAPQQEVSIEVNGQLVGMILMKKGLKTYSLNVRPEVIVEGSNILRFYYKRATRPQDVDPGSTDIRLLAAWFDWITFQYRSVLQGETNKPHVTEEQKISIYSGGTLEYFVVGHQGAKLCVATVEGEAESFAVQVKTQDSKVLSSHEVFIPSKDVCLDLGMLERQYVYISFHVNAKQGKGKGEVLLEKAQLMFRGQKPKQTKLPDIVFYLIDTLRKDRLGSYGNPQQLTPQLDRFAKDAVVFGDMIAQSSWTKSSVGSLLSGLDPIVHQANLNADILPKQVLTIAEILRAHGYYTAAFVANPAVSYSFGFAQGYLDFFAGKSVEDLYYTRSDSLNSQIFDFLNKNMKREYPLFLYVQTMDPHEPYIPNDKFRKIYAPSVDRVVGGFSFLKNLKKGYLEKNAKLKNDLLSVYNAEVAFNDTSFGELLDFLKCNSLFDSSLFVVLSDHGEEFLEHGDVGHRNTLFSESLEIPLLIKLPSSDTTTEKQLYARSVQHVDVAPTLLNLLMIPVESTFSGIDLFKRRDDRSIAYSYLALDNGMKSSSIKEEHWKYYTTQKEPQEPSRYLFNTAEDPGENLNLSVDRKANLDRLASLLKAYHQSIKRHALNKESIMLDEREARELQALGYID